MSLGQVRFILTSATDWGNKTKTIQSGDGTSLGKPIYIARQESVSGEFIRNDAFLFFAVNLSDTETIGTVADGQATNTFGFVQFEDNGETYQINKATLYNAGSFIYICGAVSSVLP